MWIPSDVLNHNSHNPLLIALLAETDDNCDPQFVECARLPICQGWTVSSTVHIERPKHHLNVTTYFWGL